MLQNELKSTLRRTSVTLASLIGSMILPPLGLPLAHAQGPNAPRWTPAPARVAAVGSPDRGDRIVPIVPAAMPQEVLRLHDAIFRIDVYEDNVCVGQGTGFAMKVIGRRVMIATCAHVLEEDRSPKFVFKEDADGQPTLAVEEPGSQQKMRAFKVVQRGDGRSYDVLKANLHPQRQAASGPDVGIVEIEIPATHPLPPTFEVLPSQDQEPLHGQTVHLLGCPGVLLADLDPDAPFYGRGMISQVDKQQRWIAYDMAAGAGASGSPLFILRPNRSGGQTAYVVGIHCCGQMSTKLSCGVHVRRIAEVVKQSLESETRTYGPDKPIKLMSGNGELRAIQGGGEVLLPPQQIVPVKTLPQIRDLVRQGFPYLALRELDKLIQSQEKVNQPIPIDYEILRVKLLIDHGMKLNGGSVNRRLTYKIDGQAPVEFVGSALGQFTEAIQILERLDAPNAKDRDLYLLYLRAAAHKGRVLKDEQNDRTVLAETHRLLHDLVRNERLSDLNQARCQLLLGFVHYHLGTTPADLRQAESDFAHSYRLFPSRQADEWLGHLHGIRGLVSNRLDIWEVSGHSLKSQLNAQSF